MNDSDSIDVVTAASLQKVLNTHGHGFHYAVATECAKLCHRGQSQFRLLSAEYPVQLNGADTSLDILLSGRDILVTAECKRADPATARWTFVRAPIGDGEYRDILPIISGLIYRPTEDGLKERAVYLVGPQKPFSIGFDLRTGRSGDGRGDRNPIASAVEQAIKGAGGLMSRLKDEPTLAFGEGVSGLFVVPVVFTTATLFVSEVDLSAADLTSGESSNVSVSQVSWLWYQVSFSKTLRPLIPPEYGDTETLTGALVRRHTRAVAVVSAQGISTFLQSLGYANFRML
jgi:hypothetical protein